MVQTKLKRIGDGMENIIEQICLEEQTGYAQESRAFNPILEATAQSLKDCCGITGPVVSLEDTKKLAKLFNVEVGDVPDEEFPNLGNALLIRDICQGKLRTVIFIKESAKLPSVKFSICHEIAHLIRGHYPRMYHLAVKSFRSFRKYLRNEFEANHIAGAVLLDRHAFMKDLQETKYDLMALAAKYEVTYETAAHRAAVLSEDMDIHFLKCDSTGKVVKQMTRSTQEAYWRGMRTICAHSAARQALKKAPGDIVTQFSELVDENRNIVDRLYCFANKVVKDNGETYSISIGCKEGFQDNFLYLSQPDTPIERRQISRFHCLRSSSSTGICAAGICRP
jgi:predicted transcriptional regulator